MDEFVPGNTDPERRGRVAYERLGAHSGPWVEQDGAFRQAWCHAAEAAFEEGRAFEREQLEAQHARDVDRGGPDGVVLQHGERMVSYVYRTTRGSTVAVEVTQ